MPLASTGSLVSLVLLASVPTVFQPTPQLPFAPAPRVVAVEADRDATLFEETNGQLASGAGEGLFVGKTLQGCGALRRILLHFTPPEIPGNGHGSVLESAVLVLHASPTLPSQPDPAPLRLHEVLADWGEGASVAPPPGGTGTLAQPGDATWVYSSFSFSPAEAVYWMHNGAQFAGQPLAAAAREGDTWRFSSAELTALVARWLASPESNFGLIVIGNETIPMTAKTIASREHPEPSVHPVLELTVRSGVRGDAVPSLRPDRPAAIRAR